MTQHPCGRCDRCSANLKLCLVHDARISVPDDPWLIDYIFEDEEVDLTLFAQVDNTTLIFDVDRVDEVIKVLDSHSENCAMQDSAVSAAFLDGLVVGLRGIPRG